MSREPDKDVQPGEGQSFRREGKGAALPDSQIEEGQRRQDVGPQKHHRRPLAACGPVTDRVTDGHEAVSQLLCVLLVQVKGDGPLGRLAHRVENHPAGPHQPEQQGPLDGQRGQRLAPQDALLLGGEGPPQPKHPRVVQRPAACLQQHPACPAEEEQQRGVLPQSGQQSAQAEFQQGVCQWQQTEENRLAQEAEGCEGVIMPLLGHGASSARMWARSPACWAGMAGRMSFAPGAATMSSETPPSRIRGVE